MLQKDEDFLEQKGYEDLEKNIKNFGRLKKFLIEFKEIVDTGKLSEFYCEKLWNLKKSKKQNQKGFDLKDESGKKYEVKYRKDSTNPGMEIKDKDSLDSVLYVHLDENLLPEVIKQFKSKDIQYTKNPPRVTFKGAEPKIIFQLKSGDKNKRAK
jgi:hypothetical protein